MVKDPDTISFLGKDPDTVEEPKLDPHLLTYFHRYIAQIQIQNLLQICHGYGYGIKVNILLFTGCINVYLMHI